MQAIKDLKERHRRVVRMEHRQDVNEEYSQRVQTVSVFL